MVVESVVSSSDLLQEEHSQNLPRGGFTCALESERVLRSHVSSEIYDRRQSDVSNSLLEIL